MTFNWVRAVGEGILMALILGLISKRSPDIETASKYRTAAFAAYILIEIASVVALYSGQEESALFFAHSFLVFFIVNLSDYAVYKRGVEDRKTAALEKLALWNFLVIPVM